MNTIPRPVSFNQLSLPYLRAFVGLVLILLSLYATISFLSQGFTGLAFLSVVVFCLAIEAVKILFSGDIGFYLALREPEKALFSFLMVSILFCLSVGSETWFLLSGSLKGSTQIEQTASRSAGLEKQIAAKQAQIAACNPNHLSKCVNPRTAELSALQGELNKVSASATANADAMANEKFWKQMGEATGTSPENLQLGLDLTRAFLQELFGLYFLGQFSTWKRLKAMALEEESDIDPYLNHKPRDGSPRSPDRQEPKFQGNVTPTPVVRPTVQLPPVAPVAQVSVPAPTVRAPVARSPKAADIWTPKEKEQMLLANISTLLRENETLRKTADVDKGSSVFDSLSVKPKVKTSALDMTKLTPKQ